jgi:anti-anti-sigma factor
LTSDFRVTVRAEGDATVMVLDGELDLASFPKFEHAIDRALESVPRLLVLDLGELEFMDVAGLRSVVRSDQRLRGVGGRLVVAAPGRAVRRLLALTRHEDDLEVADTTAEALGR